MTDGAAIDKRFAEAQRHFAARRLDSAERSYRAVIAAAPGFAQAHYNLGLVLRERGRFAHALHAFERAIKAQPDYAKAHVALGLTAERLGDGARAEAELQHAIAADPNSAQAHRILGDVLRGQGRIEEALGRYEHALAIDPTDAEAQFGRGFARLLLGDLVPGWTDYECRAAAREVDPVLRPRWAGETIAGKRLLLHGEQGIGDTIQFLRYVPHVVAQGARIVLAVPVPLIPLAERIAGIAEIARPSPAPPPFDVSCPLPSLPLRFATTLQSMPRGIPYLSVPPERIAQWRQRLGRDERKLVAFVWAGNRDHPNDHNRSLPLADLAPLLATPGLRFVSLQKGARDDAGRLSRAGVLSLGEELKDFADTGAVMELADLVITVDTSTCHLAGALGRPTWVLLPFAPDWRWMTERTESPWYPTMRLYRQAVPGAWPALIETVRRDLIAFASQP